MPVLLRAAGDENAVSFPVAYDKSLGVPQVALGEALAGATLITNTRTAGELGLVLALPAGQTLPVGEQVLVTLTFRASNKTSAAAVRLGTGPVGLEVVNAQAQVVPSAFRPTKANH